MSSGDVRTADTTAQASRTRGESGPPGYETRGHGEPEVRLTDVLAVLLGNKWLILSIAAVALAIGAFSVWRTTPVYRAAALLRVEDSGRGMLPGEDALRMLSDQPAVPAELEILRSLRVARAVVERLELDLITGVRHFPIVGEPAARRHGGRPGPAHFGLEQYAWGGERFEVGTFEVADGLRGHTFTLVALPEGRYRLFGENGEEVFTGEVGARERTVFAGERLELVVETLVARPETEFVLRRDPIVRVANTLRERLQVTEKGRETGVLEVALQGSDPDRLRDVVNAVLDVYITQDVERKAEEAQRRLAFVERQLPEIKAELDEAERQLNVFRDQRISVDLDTETQATLSRLVSTETQLAELRRQREELLLEYTPQHPRIVTVDTRIGQLEQEILALETEVRSLPEVQQQIIRLERDVQVNTGLYTALLNTAQELRIARAGIVPGAYVVDDAYRPYRPIEPRTTRTLALSLILGLFFGTALAFGRAMLGGVEDPDRIEQILGVPVYATVPYSRSELRVLRGGERPHRLLALTVPDDPAIESLRSLRTALHFTFKDADLPVLMVTGPTPGVGKTFLTANLGTLRAEIGGRVLVIDADLRKGTLHRYFSVTRGPGLAEFLCGEREAGDVLRTTAVQGVDVVTAGRAMKNGPELLSRDQFARFVEEQASMYDLVIIDTPPALMFSDAGIAGRPATAALLVVKDGEHHMRQLEQTARQLEMAGVRLDGVVFNQMKASSGRYGYGRYYGYQYYGYRYAHDGRDGDSAPAPRRARSFRRRLWRLRRAFAFGRRR